MGQDTLEKAFLTELEALEKFRISYTGLYRNTPLSREDPDVRRLIEAMAMFTARTRLASQRNIDRSMLRMFGQHFPYLLGPSPATAMLRAAPKPGFVDVAEVPRGTEVYLIRGGTREAPEQVFRFRTLAKLRILPIELSGVNILRLKGRGFRILLRFAAAFPRNDGIGDLTLYINHLDDLASSLMVRYELKAHLRSASVSFEKQVNEDTQGQPCDVAFGLPEGARQEIEKLEHPLQRARSMVHSPRQDLFLTIRGIRQPRNWERFTICLDVDEGWPTELRLTSDGFQLDVVPMINLRADMATPIECDGTKERHVVRHPDNAAGFVPQGVVGVYRMTKQGLSPLEPAVVGKSVDSYEIAFEGDGADRRGWAILNLPNAFEKPERVAVEALWHQPSLKGHFASDLKVRLADRFVANVEWSCSGPLVPYAESELEDDRDGLLQLLSIRNQRFLDRDGLLVLLRALGAYRDPALMKTLAALTDVKVVSKPFARKSSGFKYIYELTFETLEASDMPRLDLFCRTLLGALIAWSTDEVVELVARVRNLEKEIRCP